MKKTSLLALAMIGPFAFLTPAHAEEKAPAGINADAKRDLAKIFDGKLIDAAGKPVKSDNLAKAKYVAVYFSAHWCPPCRAFTPKLVDFVNANRKDGNFDIVFVSYDRDLKAMQEYMTVTKMPWPGVFSKGADLKDLADGDSGIPCLRLFDREGRLVSDSYVNGEYVGPQHVLDELAKKLK